jgi:aminoglycoside phosphotransferase (APT) family kinase protein
MWHALLDNTAAVAAHGRLLAEAHIGIASVVPPVNLPSFADRVRCKVRTAAPLVDLHAGDVLAALPTDDPAALCHGDLHPGNVVLGTDGPMIVDWFDAGLGDPVADIARTTLLIAPDTDGAAPPRHLPGGDLALRRRLLDEYLVARGALDSARLDRWRAVMAIARIAEGVDSTGLDALWRTWQGSGVEATR